MEQLNVVNDTQKTVVESDIQTADKGGTISKTSGYGAHTEFADRIQSRAENSGFRKLRLENESCKKEINELKSRLSRLSELEDIKKQNSLYLDKLVNDKMERDLEIIKKMDPSIDTLGALGDEFIRLIESGSDAKTAFCAIRKATDGMDIQKVPELGSIEHSEGTPSRYFTSKELDRLTKKDLENPKIFKKAMESLQRL